MIIDFAHSVYTIDYNERTHEYKVYKAGKDVTSSVSNELVDDLLSEIVEMRKVMQVEEE